MRHLPAISMCVLGLLAVAACSDPKERSRKYQPPSEAEDETTTTERCTNACRMIPEKLQGDGKRRSPDEIDRDMAKLLGYAIGSGFLIGVEGDGYAGGSLDTKLATACLDRCKAGWFSSTCIYTATSVKAVRRCVKPPTDAATQ